MSVETEKEEKKKVAPKKKKEKTPPEAHWQEMIKVYFDFYKERFFGEEPTFDGSAPRDLKSILTALRIRAEKKGLEWSLEVATNRFIKFLAEAYEDKWLTQNFILFNINRQKDRIFVNIANPNQNGRNSNYWQNIGLNGSNGSQVETAL